MLQPGAGDRQGLSSYPGSIRMLLSPAGFTAYTPDGGSLPPEIRCSSLKYEISSAKPDNMRIWSNQFA